MRSAVVAPLSLCALALLPLAGTARAQPADKTGVIGGSNAALGAWPDVAGVLYQDLHGDEALCSGTLIAPTIVLTAGHCYVGTLIPDNVLIGANDLGHPENGETIAVRTGFVYPNAESSEDVTALVLATPSTRTPRALATGWAATDIQNGAKVELVGFGAIDKDGEQFINELQQAETTIIDFDCSKSSGCNSSARPAGELGAGGMGVDTCPGDSGGPLYLKTSYGTYLAGVTSRSFDDAKVSCSDGGIYARPDKFVAWIESVTGVKVSHGPEPTVDMVTVAAGGFADTQITVNDPGSTEHDFDVTVAPMHGRAGINRLGKVRVCIDAATAAGTGSVQVKITDRKSAHRTLTVTVPVTISSDPPAADATGCDPSATAGAGSAGSDDGGDFAGLEDAGCCDSGRGSHGAIPLTIGVLAFVARRRRR